MLKYPLNLKHYRQFDSDSDVSNNNEDVPNANNLMSIDFPLHDQETYFNQVTTGRIFPQPPPQLKIVPPPNWLFSPKTDVSKRPCPFGTSSLKYYQTFLGVKLLEDCHYVLAKQNKPSKGHKVDRYMKFTYEIVSPSGSIIFCKTEAMNCLQKFISCGISSYTRPYVAKLVDSWATRSLIIKQDLDTTDTKCPERGKNNWWSKPFHRFFTTKRVEYVISLENGYLIGTVYRSSKRFRRGPRFYIKDAEDSTVIEAIGKRYLRKSTMPSVGSSNQAKLRSHYKFNFYRIERGRNNETMYRIGKVTKLNDALSEAERNDSNRYIFKLLYKDPIHVRTKLLLLGASFVIDYVYWRSEK